MTSLDRDSVIQRAARRASDDRFFLGSALATYQAEHGLTDDALAARIGCHPTQLLRLRLCRRPNPRSGTFRRAVEQIAEFTGIPPLRLATLLREVDATEALSEGAGRGGALLAARDASPDETG